MKIYRNISVFDAALERIRLLFAEFPVVVCCVSGGKDSTVCYHLCLRVAEELGRLPLPVMWIDQEVEWQATVDMCEQMMSHPNVRPLWFQMPMVITNNASTLVRFNRCWAEDERDKWMRPKHPMSVKVNRYGTDRFHDLFNAIMGVEYKDTPACMVSGVRTEENPTKRFIALTDTAKYKWITWGRRLNARRGHYTFYPIYDWTWRDVWKAIHDHGWPYNRVYDYFYRYGRAVRDMRVSNLHHETAIQNLLLVQEIEPQTWSRLCDRIPGANSIKHCKRAAFTCPTELPFMFDTWQQYAAHIIETLVTEPANRKAVQAKLVCGLGLYVDEPIRTDFIRTIITTVLSADWDYTKLINWHLSPDANIYRHWKKGDVVQRGPITAAKYIPPHALRAIRKEQREIDERRRASIAGRTSGSDRGRAE